MHLSRTETTDLRAGEVIAGRFRLERPLSQGGMGCVWIAFHTTLGIEVAIKFVDVDGDARAEALRRFEREANVVARLRSSHVVQILDYGVDESQRAYIVMELLHGESLRDRLKRTNILPFETAARVVLQICRALHRAHKAGIVHRDIKPANIFLCEEDDGLLVKVLDFGIAKASGITGSDHQSTATGAIVGTPAYMSPEQARGSVELDGRSDLFSLAIVAWRCIVGRHPHEPDGKPLGLGELLIAITTRPVVPPSTFVTGLPQEMDEWFARALALDVGKRFESAKVMADALATASQLPAANMSATGQTSIANGGISLTASGDNPLFDSDQNVASTPSDVRARARGLANANASAAEISGTSLTGAVARAAAAAAAGAAVGDGHGTDTSEATNTIASTPSAKASASWSHISIELASGTPAAAATATPRSRALPVALAAVLVLAVVALFVLRSNAPAADAPSASPPTSAASAAPTSERAQETPAVAVTGDAATAVEPSVTATAPAAVTAAAPPPSTTAAAGAPSPPRATARAAVKPSSPNAPAAPSSKSNLLDDRL